MYLVSRHKLNCHRSTSCMIMKRLASLKTHLVVLQKCVHTSGFQLQRSAGSADVLNKTREFVRKEIVSKTAELAVASEFPWQIIRDAHQLGILNVDTPTQLGGLGLNLDTKTRVFQELAYGCSTIAASLMISELAQIPLLLSGSDYLKQEYVARMLKEPILAAFSVTEHEAGSDLAAAQASAIEDGDSFVLNGTKAWVSNGGLASWFFVLARTSTTARTGQAFTGFVIDRDLKGVSFGDKEPILGHKCGDIRSLILNDVRVPKKNIVGSVGQGFKLTMQAFDRVRPLVASLGCGIQQRAIDESVQFAIKRKTFGVPVIQHQAVSVKLANMVEKWEASKLLIKEAARKIENNDSDIKYFSSIVKSYCTNAALKASINAVQIFGAKGCSTQNPVEKLLRDSNGLQFMSGANDIQQRIISHELSRKYLNL